MNAADIQANWARWMHRNDLEADIADVANYAQARIVERLMNKNATFDEVLLRSPQAYLHAGLVYLAELVMDDDQLQKETELFNGAIGNFNFRWSLDTVTPDPMEADNGT